MANKVGELAGKTIYFSVQPSVFSVSPWLTNSQQQLTTETQRTQRLHREERAKLVFCSLPFFGWFHSRNVTAHLPEVYDWLAIDLYPLVRLKD